MFLANRTRPDFLAVVSFLSTRAFHHCPKDIDIVKKLMGYVIHTIDKFMTLSSTDLRIYVWTDTSHGNHISTRQSQSAMVLSLGRDPTNGVCTGFILAASHKEHDVALSTCEAELHAQIHSAKYLLWLKQLMICLGFPEQKEIIIFQDNQAAISMAVQGKGNFRNVKHFETKCFFMHQHVKNNNVKMSFLETEMMIPDVITKPVQGSLLKKLTAMLLNETSFDWAIELARPKNVRKRKIVT